MIAGILPAESRTATTTTADLYSNDCYEAVHVVIVTTVITNSVVPKLQGKDAYGNYYDLLVGTAISTTGTVVLKLGPCINPIAGGAAQDMLPDVYRVVMTHSNANATTYSVAINGGDV